MSIVKLVVSVVSPICIVLSSICVILSSLDVVSLVIVLSGCYNRLFKEFNSVVGGVKY